VGCIHPAKGKVECRDLVKDGNEKFQVPLNAMIFLEQLRKC
jgi:hypothetical protein